MIDLHTTIEQTFRAEQGRVLAHLISTLRDFDFAEDMLQDALISALEKWPEQGIPDNPGAWLTRTARNRAIDKLRRAQNYDRKLDVLKRLTSQVAASPEEAAMEHIPDERLKLIFTCCHPAIALEAQVALTLKTLGGLTTEEIASAFLVPKATMAQRIVRAKRKIAKAGIPYRVPPTELLPERVRAVLATLYLIFNEGYSASEGDQLVRRDLCGEAIRLGRVLALLMPNDPEVLGLLALMLLQHSRAAARSNSLGELVLLADQDRSQWDYAAIEEGAAILDQAMEMRQPGMYQIQAAIAALHAEANSAENTDWRQIAMLYASLWRINPSPIILLNRAVAISMADGPIRGLAALDIVAEDGRLENYYPYHVSRADMLRRAGFWEDSAESYALALTLTNNRVEQAFLKKRLHEVEASC